MLRLFQSMPRRVVNPINRMTTRIPACIAAWLLLLAMPLAAFAQDGRVSDAQMVGILIVANQSQIAAGQLALRKTQSRSVQGFANRIVSESQQVNQEADDMLRRLGASAQRSGTSDAIARQSRDELDMLNQTDVYSFDQDFLDREVAFLGRLIQTVDGFIRTTTSPDVKTLLVRARPAFTFHLDQARRLQYVLERPGFGR
jgi:putative membrane protein